MGVPEHCCLNERLPDLHAAFRFLANPSFHWFARAFSRLNMPETIDKIEILILSDLISKHA